MSTYRVRGWNDNFEGAKSRTYNNKTTCQMPSKHGLGYRRLVRRKNGPALFGAWCALIQILSRHNKERDGYCTDTGRQDGKPYTASDLELLTDIPEKVFEELFQVASSQDVDWIEVSNHTDTTRIPDGDRAGSVVPLHSNSDSNSDSDSDSTACGELGGFDLFWDAYPRKAKKKEAQRAWKKAKDRPDISAIIEKIRSLKATVQWQKEGGQFIPYPSSWLNAGGWSDSEKIEVAKKAKNERYVEGSLL